MSDIVERLRDRWEHMGDSARKKISRILVERRDAAEEIERLRAALDDAADLVEKFSGADAVYPEGMRMIADNIRARKAKNFG